MGEGNSLFSWGWGIEGREMEMELELEDGWVGGGGVGG